FAMAQREIGLAAGEPPTAKGYTPSVLSMLARLVERVGRFSTGSITAFYTVLMEGDDQQDPIVDTVRSLLDGHSVLDRNLALRHHYPPISLLERSSGEGGRTPHDDRGLYSGGRPHQNWRLSKRNGSIAGQDRSRPAGNQSFSPTIPGGTQRDAGHAEAIIRASHLEYGLSICSRRAAQISRKSGTTRIFGVRKGATRNRSSRKPDSSV